MNPTMPLLVCEVDDAAKDLVISLLVEAGATAVLEGPGTAGMTELQAGFRSDVDAEAAKQRIAGAVAARVEHVAADVWVTSQRPAIEPVTAGRFDIRAPWHDPPKGLLPDRLPIVIDPGSAFGHGGHPSTAMLLGLLDRVVTEDSTVVDFGSGSGVLAIAAAMLGARVYALEIDAGAVDIARANVALNRVDDRVDIVRMADGPLLADVALVNLTIAEHRGAAPLLDQVPVIAASGILEGQYAELRALYGPREVATVERTAGWVAAILG